ncbi:hypothetical protein BDR04DRAFT_1086314 [Suillus decipiens]|nr:hypothetical protein BDR04DRAFT_1086314 [Suillus decipiens]
MSNDRNKLIRVELFDSLGGTSLMSTDVTKPDAVPLLPTVSATRPFRAGAITVWPLRIDRQLEERQLGNSVYFVSPYSVLPLVEIVSFVVSLYGLLPGLLQDLLGGNW